MIPPQIGRYTIGAHLGAGAFANVYSGFDPLFDIDVAVKILAENAAFDPDTRERFINEARLQRQGNHPHLIRVHDLGEFENRPFLVMDLATGGTLAERLDNNGGRQHAPNIVLRVASQLAAGMHAVHQLGVVHRDLKPSNLLIRDPADADDAENGRLLGPGERLTVADFGLARALHATGLTAVSGTPGYMAPEQWQASGALDERTDLFAATMIVAELLTGRPPSTDRGDLDAWLALDPRIQSFLTKGTADAPDDRHESIAEWASDLSRALDQPAPELPPSARCPPTLREPTEIPSGRAPETVVSPSRDEPARRWPKRRTMFSIAVMVTLIAAVVGTIRVATSAGDADPPSAEYLTSTGAAGVTSTTTTLASTTSNVPPSSARAAAPLELVNPTAALGLDDGSVLIADGDRLLVIGDEGAEVLLSRGVFDEPIIVDADLRRIADLAMAPDGSLLVADVGSGRVLRLTPDDQLETIGTFTGPAAIAVAEDGTIFVAESLGRRVVRLDVESDPAVFGPEFVGPVGLAIDGESVLVAERSARLISRFDLDGELIDQIETESTSESVLAGIAVAEDGAVLWADAGRHQVFRSDGGTVSALAGTGVIGDGAVGAAATSIELAEPLDVAISGDAVLVVDTGNDRVIAVGPGGSTSLLAGTAA